VAGPVRRPRRSERYPSLVRVDTINGRPAEEVAEGTRYDELPASWPTERLALGGEDPTLQAVDSLAPFGKGSRVTISGPARAGKTEALRRLAGALAALEGMEVSLVLVGVRPEELGEAPIEPAAALSFAASADAQAQAVEQAVEQGRRVAARGGDAIVLIDTLEHLPQQPARRALAAARNIIDGGSLTVVATAAAPLGGETTVVALDQALVALGRVPALDLARSGVMRSELLVGEAGAEAIAKTRLEQLPG
jgi:transcription termination factor Rho